MDSTLVLKLWEKTEYSGLIILNSDIVVCTKLNFAAMCQHVLHPTNGFKKKIHSSDYT